MKVIFKGSGGFRLHLSKVKSKMLTRILLGKMAALAVSLIFDRTVKEGKDKSNIPFKEYSRDYLEKKKKKGGKFFKTTPNLFDGGDMMGDLSFFAESKHRAFLHFPKTEESLKASGHINSSPKVRLPKRDFFGLIPKEEKEILLIPESHLEKVLNG